MALSDIKQIVEMQREDETLWLDPNDLTDIELADLVLNLQTYLQALHAIIDKYAEYSSEEDGCENGKCNL